MGFVGDELDEGGRPRRPAGGEGIKDALMAVPGGDKGSADWIRRREGQRGRPSSTAGQRQRVEAAATMVAGEDEVAGDELRRGTDDFHE
uniref:DUF834 domain-containing protein n=1 Tax=Leersia perrieri TaxID=77586 RepID=A0A0D9V3Y0_9ORYZ